ncbi:ankyrin repeat domain-containing protein 1-like [Branchiostoma lanceolatum]|uniref:ankyrin repeat domain-containing protein 1-like n=1 Tax=Branchiostoma lanceolatum TaxID=7740 RepID=UPI003455BAD9
MLLHFKVRQQGVENGGPNKMAGSSNANKRLFDAAAKGSLQDAKASLKAGADIDFRDPDGEVSSTALFIASHRGHVDIVRLLLRKGASVVKRTRGWTEVVDLLVNHGATLDVRDRCRDTPLMHACIYRQVDTVRRLIELGARVDLTDDYGYCQVAQTFGMDRHWEECMKLIRQARKSKLLRCCNPKCGKPGYR